MRPHQIFVFAVVYFRLAVIKAWVKNLYFSGEGKNCLSLNQFSCYSFICTTKSRYFYNTFALTWTTVDTKPNLAKQWLVLTLTPIKDTCNLVNKVYIYCTQINIPNKITSETLYSSLIRQLKIELQLKYDKIPGKILTERKWILFFHFEISS